MLTLSLKINRQSDLDELFSKFALDPDRQPKKEQKDKDSQKKEQPKPKK
ncbi:SPJ_0845 family protein [Ligilactobacillus salitolerans]|nr:SPJ_0845 family protein [Ligilactobacillus salitolerans]